MRVRDSPPTGSAPRRCRGGPRAAPRSSAAATSAFRGTRRIPHARARCSSISCRARRRPVSDASSDGSPRGGTFRSPRVARRLPDSSRCATRSARDPSAPITSGGAAHGSARFAPSCSTVTIPSRRCGTPRAMPVTEADVERRRFPATALLAAPLVLFLVFMLGYPMLSAVRLAFRDPVSVALELVAGVGLALLLAARMPARRLVRAMVVVPFALPEIVFLAITRSILTPRGYANGVFSALGIGPIAFLVPGRATTYATVMLVDAWHTTPVVFLIVLGGLAAIPRQIHEAAELDGARGWRHLVFITLPLLRPALVAAVLVRGLDALRIFAAPLVLAGVEGAPVLSTYAYHQWSDYGDDGVAAAASVVLALLCVLASVPLLARRAARADLA